MGRLNILLLFLAVASIPLSMVRADVSLEIARVEKLPRSSRLAEYEVLAAKKGLSKADRTDVIKGFARHAGKVSPVYGKSSHRIDAKRWQAMLAFAHAQ